MTSRDEKPEQLVIRPPSEWRSILVRVTRGCRWNRCRFCGIYPRLGEPGFSVRPIEDIKRDIRLLRERSRNSGGTAFLGDADPLQAGVETFTEVCRFLRETFPELRRLTCYARASTIWKMKQAGVMRLAKAGLNRVHIGLESGDAGVLKYHRKGLTPEIAVEAGRLLKEAGIEVSFYVLLGLGGADRWQEHVDGTAEVVNRADPDFVRLRRIWLYTADDYGSGAECPLWSEVHSGRFIPQSAEGTVLELRRLIEKLDGVTSNVVCDHANNYVRVEGRLPTDKPAMLASIDGFLALSPEERKARYAEVGSHL